MSAVSPSAALSASGSLSSSLSVPSSILTANASPTPPLQRPDGAAPSNPAGNGGNGNGGNQNSFGNPPQLTSSASLYPTIVLLLLVSITIVARSYALRRRQQALIAEAIANGTYVPPKKPGALGEKPKMYEIFIGEKEVEEEGAQDLGGERAASPEKQKEKEVEREKEPERFEDGLAVDWDRIMPVACRWLTAPDNSQSPPPDSAPTPPPVSTSRRHSRFSLASLPGRRMSSSSRDQAQSPVPPPSELTVSGSPTADRPDTRLSLLAEKPPLTPEPPEEKVRVSVLISMPFADPSRKRKSMASALTAASTSTAVSQTESELPYVELGTTEVSAGSLRSSLEVSAAFPPPNSTAAAVGSADSNTGGRSVDLPPAAESDMNV
ncbi:hypothetical protein GSI_03123 [Ganoderma sinense ZZ0214-1]|uniref:Uncharacterized protein n=1 Tax=Ganoderma sinense ZZ0214-1 TaxID=1077348 RepID=A0A2G8SL98_9APHY|nr:hypothetical protein GSI_03123 [Ganoderma sinense ZZ0214-1]